LNDSVLYSLDPEILELCDELESLGGGIKTRIETIQAQVLSRDQFTIDQQIMQKAIRN
jgi:hypothetical protein